MIKVIIYKIGQIVGCGACISFAYGLLSGRLFEPNPYIYWPEIIGSIIAAIILGADFLNIHPEFD